MAKRSRLKHKKKQQSDSPPESKSPQKALRTPDARELHAEVAEELALGVGSTVREGVLRKLPDSLVRGVE